MVLVLANCSADSAAPGAQPAQVRPSGTTSSAMPAVPSSSTGAHAGVSAPESVSETARYSAGELWLDEESPMALSVSGDYLYWVSAGDELGTLRRRGVGGGPVETLGTMDRVAHSIAVHEGRIWVGDAVDLWVVDGGDGRPRLKSVFTTPDTESLKSLSVQGGRLLLATWNRVFDLSEHPKMVQRAGPKELDGAFAADKDWLYTSRGDGKHKITRRRWDGTEASTVIELRGNEISDLALDGDTLFVGFTAKTADGVAGPPDAPGLLAVPARGGEPRTLVTGVATHDLAVHKSEVLFANALRVMRVPKKGGAPTTLVELAGARTVRSYFAISGDYAFVSAGAMTRGIVRVQLAR